MSSSVAPMLSDRVIEDQERIAEPGLSWLMDLFIVCAILLVVAAIGIGLVDEAGLPPVIAMLAAGALLVTLLCSHIVIRRVAAIRRINQTVERLEDQLDRLAEFHEGFGSVSHGPAAHRTGVHAQVAHTTGPIAPSTATKTAEPHPERRLEHQRGAHAGAAGPQLSEPTSNRRSPVADDPKSANEANPVYRQAGEPAAPASPVQTGRSPAVEAKSGPGRLAEGADEAPAKPTVGERPTLAQRLFRKTPPPAAGADAVREREMAAVAGIAAAAATARAAVSKGPSASAPELRDDGPVAYATQPAPRRDTPTADNEPADHELSGTPSSPSKPALRADSLPEWTVRPGTERTEPTLTYAPPAPLKKPDPAPERLTREEPVASSAIAAAQAARVSDQDRRSPTDEGHIRSVLERMAVDIGSARGQGGPRPAGATGSQAAHDTTAPAPAGEPDLAYTSYGADAVSTPPVVAKPPPVPAARTAPAADPFDVFFGMPQDDAAIAAEADPADAAAKAQLDAITSALAHEHIDVFLEPIKALEDNAAKHYEVTVRLRLDEDDAEGCDRATYTAATSGTPLLPLIDTLALARTRNVAWRLMAHDFDGRVFTAADTESLSSDQFMEDFEHVLQGSRDTARRIVLSFPQSDVRALTSGQAGALRRLQVAGLSFGIEQLTDLETDFEALAGAGFNFVKLDADVFLDGLPVGTTRVPADDICRHFGAMGLLPIVGHIRDREQLQRLRACGVTLGQGPLLGVARVVKMDWQASQEAA